MKRPICLFLICILLALAGCRTVPTQEQTQHLPDVSDAPLSPHNSHRRENVVGNTWWFPAECRDGFYLVGSSLSYYDPQSGERTNCCALPDCTHTAAPCAAQLEEGVVRFAEYRGLWYYTVDDPSGDLRLICVDPQSGKRTTVYTWAGSDTELYRCSRSQFAYGCAYITYIHEVTAGDETETTYRTDCVDLESGAYTSFEGYGKYLCSSATYQVFQSLRWTAHPLRFDAFYREHPDATGESYVDYLMEFSRTHTVSELRLYARNSDTYRVIAQGNVWEIGAFPDPNLCYEDQMIYRDGDALMLCDLSTGETEEILRHASLTDAALMDRKLFYCLDTQYYCMDLDSRTAMRFQNCGETDSWVFHISDETDTLFIGVYDGAQHWIPKEDFYAENYTAAVPMQ